MKGLFSNYGFSLKLAVYVALGFVLVAAAVAFRARRAGLVARERVARLMFAGSAAVVVIATALPRDWPPQFGPGDLVLELGRGGLSDWRVLYENPNSLSAVLLVANVLLYIPLATFGVLGWRRRILSVLAGCLLLSLLVELAQRVFLEGIASLDDVLLNATGALIGSILGAGLVRRGRAGAARAIG